MPTGCVMPMPTSVKVISPRETPHPCEVATTDLKRRLSFAECACVKRTLSDANASIFGVCTWLYFFPSPMMSRRETCLNRYRQHSYFLGLLHFIKDHLGSFQRILRLNNRSAYDNVIGTAPNRLRWCRNATLVAGLCPLRTDTRV